MISICIPVYNYDCNPLLEQLIQQCKQHQEFTEILVYDDCSATMYPIKVESNLIHTFKGNKNIGSVQSRQFLANKATNDWLLFLDTDLALPSPQFLGNYLHAIDNGKSLYYGGVVYQEQRPDDDLILRWLYGRQRETRTPQNEDDLYTFFVSCSFLIKKNTFDAVFSNTKMKGYGQDVFISLLLKKQNVKIGFIDNPVIHLGLESNKTYLRKSLEGVETSYLAEKAGWIPDNFRPVQRAYLTIKKTGAIKLFLRLIKNRKTALEKNLLSKNPKLIYLDFLKLYHYSRLKLKD